MKGAPCGRAGQGGCVGHPQLFPILQGLQTRAHSSPLPASEGVSPGHRPPLFRQLPPCHLSFLPSVPPSPPRWLHCLSPALALWSNPPAPATGSAAAFTPADGRSVHLHPGLFPSVPGMPAGRASSWANRCIVATGETKPWTREGLPMGSPEDTHSRRGQSPQNASGTPRGALGGCAEDGTQAPGKQAWDACSPGLPRRVMAPKQCAKPWAWTVPPLGCAAGLWVGRHFLVRAGCGETGHVASRYQVPVLAGRETFRSRTVGDGCSRPCQAREPSEHLAAREHRWATRGGPHPDLPTQVWAQLCLPGPLLVVTPPLLPGLRPSDPCPEPRGSNCPPP